MNDPNFLKMDNYFHALGHQLSIRNWHDYVVLLDAHMQHLRDDGKDIEPIEEGRLIWLINMASLCDDMQTCYNECMTWEKEFISGQQTDSDRKEG